MSEPVPRADDRVRFSTIDELENTTEGILAHKYGRGIYIQGTEETENGNLRIQLGGTIPKELSDSLEKDGVVKFINIRNIYSMKAESTEGGFILHLPDRDDIQDGIQQRKKNIINQLDYSMAKAIYENVMHFGEVENQLTPLRQIFRWVREREPLSLGRINENQRSSNTQTYIKVLQELDYIWVEDGEVRAGEQMNSAEFQDLDSEQFIEAIMGDLIKQGYHVLRDRCDLRMLSHYPQFSGAYYYDAVQRGDVDLHLDMETVTKNINEQYGKSFKELYVDDKISQLSQVGVLNKDGRFVTADKDVFDAVSSDLAIA